MEKLLDKFKGFLEKVNHLRDEALFVVIKPYWPRQITPNHLSYLRIFIALVLFILLFILKIDNKALIISLFIFGAITDGFDGSVARGLNKVTEFGAVLDPTADRIFIIPIAVYGLYRFHPALLLILILVEIANGLFSIYYKSKEIYIESGVYGKTKMVLACVGLLGILIFWPNSPPGFFIGVMWVTILFSFLNVFEIISNINHAKHEKNNKSI